MRRGQGHLKGKQLTLRSASKKAALTDEEVEDHCRQVILERLEPLKQYMGGPSHTAR